MINISCNMVVQGCSHLLADPVSGDTLNLEHEPGGLECSEDCMCHDMIANSQAAHNITKHDGLRTLMTMARPAQRPVKRADG